MSLPIYQRVAVNSNGDVIPGAEYTVINENTGLDQAIYSDRNGSSLKAAPYFADANGVIQFYIATGTTFRVAATGGVGTYTDRYIYAAHPQASATDTTAGALLTVGSSVTVLTDLYVDSVENLAGFVGAVDGQQISMAGWHPDSVVGGGVLVWDAAALKSTHNGGTIFSPTVPWSVITIDYLNKIGETDPSGTGCWVRVYEKLNASFFGVSGDGITDETLVISKLFSFMSANKAPCYFNSGRFMYDGAAIDNRDDNIIIRGSGIPVSNTAKTTLTGGTVFVGTLKLRGQFVEVSGLGVDHGILEFPSTVGDAIYISSDNPALFSTCNVRNVIGLCANVTDPHHAVLIEGHTETNGENITGIKSFFGLALKTKRANITGVTAIDNDSDGIIIKSDNVFGATDFINISNVIVEGDSGLDLTSFGVRVIAFNEDISNVNISNVNVRNAVYALYLDASEVDSGSLKNVSLININGVDNGHIVLCASGTGTGSINNVKMQNVSGENTESTSIELSGSSCTDIAMDNVTIDISPTSTKAYNNVLIGASVERLSISNMNLYINGDVNNKAGITLNNDSKENKIINSDINMAGAGKPTQGYTSESVGTTTYAVNVLWDGSYKATARLVPIAGAIITTISRAQPSGERFPIGSELFMWNDSAESVTINHNPAGYIFNRGSVNLVLLPNESVKYCFGNAVWHQV